MPAEGMRSRGAGPGGVNEGEAALGAAPRSIAALSGTQRAVAPAGANGAAMGGGALAFAATGCGHYFEHGVDVSLACVASADDYVGRLRDGYVMVDRAERRAAIVDGASALVDGQGAKLRVNEGLIDEITGLVEWPHALFGRIEEQFMALPDEVLEASIRVRQKYLTTEDEDGRLTPGFVVVSNRLADAARDDVILSGNQRVLRARLADAKCFCQEEI